MESKDINKSIKINTFAQDSKLTNDIDLNCEKEVNDCHNSENIFIAENQQKNSEKKLKPNQIHSKLTE